ncbi:MAG: hypothetical protein V7K66_19225 [Nostoc sp.]
MPNRVNLPPGSELYGDSAYIDYTIEDDLEQTSYISLKVMPKKNSEKLCLVLFGDYHNI